MECHGGPLTHPAQSLHQSCELVVGAASSTAREQKLGTSDVAVTAFRTLCCSPTRSVWF